MWVLIFVSTIALLSFIGGFIAAFWYIVPRIEQNFIFRPGREIAKTPADFGIPFDQHFIETPDGCRLSAWHMRPAQPLAHVIYFHGNGGNLGILNEIFELLYQFHLEVLAIDYRGYGWSSGTPTEDGVYLDAVAAVRYFQQNLQAGDLPLVYWGRSLGGCVAAYAASQIPPDGVVLETSFPSKASLIKHYPRYRVFYPFLPLSAGNTSLSCQSYFPGASSLWRPGSDCPSSGESRSVRRVKWAKAIVPCRGRGTSEPPSDG